MGHYWRDMDPEGARDHDERLAGRAGMRDRDWDTLEEAIARIEGGDNNE